MGSFTQLTYHIVFGTKYRKPVIYESIRERLYEYMGGMIRSRNGSAMEIGGVADHVHLLARLSPNVAVTDVIRDLKSGSSKWMSELKQSAWYGWQKGYAAFTVSYSQSAVVRQYIQNQVEHHRRKSFKEEFIGLLHRHQIEFDSRYIFEDEHHG